jgi:hypothetical protein
MAIDLVPRDYGREVPLVLAQGGVSTDPVVRDGRDSALSSRCRA